MSASLRKLLHRRCLQVPGSSVHRWFSVSSLARNPNLRSTSPHGPIGVEAALRAASDPSFKPVPTLLQKEFSLAGRVAVVTGGQRGIGLETAEALAEAGATVYCLDLPLEPDKSFSATQEYVARLGLGDGARLEYATVDVTNQKAIWDVVEKIAEKEGRLDACIAAAGISAGEECLDHSAEGFSKQINVNVNGVFYTAQAVGRQMVRFGTPGSIILIASMSGSLMNRDQSIIAYNTSKGAVLQMGRSLACELGPKNIRVNTISPGYIYTYLTATVINQQPHLMQKWGSENPLNRMGRTHELRGVAVWLASDASSFCTGSDILVTGGHHAW
ncbi:NAD-binding protein [Fomitiporia mediterranea MF3/22]|uniref:NAD-binding protein n=1 Tax=Fomitiporia mediterranea (strain MF3/22) TaxID=694068 RepID=UPI00044086F6|nr:NAD-binding protein [Fomitiporia mediterranea MF3/22]EJC99849.1 NAD-binding protein [Fomitiporia mediterranea MF3/22]